MKFLVVDDSATMRRIVVNSLSRIGFGECVEAGDGVEALDSFDPSVDFVITDWNMPNMSGLDFVKALRGRDEGKAVPILMVTTRSVREDIVQAAQAGVNNYIVKPFTPQVLKEKIDHVLGAGGLMSADATARREELLSDSEATLRQVQGVLSDFAPRVDSDDAGG